MQKHWLHRCRATVYNIPMDHFCSFKVKRVRLIRWFHCYPLVPHWFTCKYISSEFQTRVTQSRWCQACNKPSSMCGYMHYPMVVSHDFLSVSQFAIYRFTSLKEIYNKAPFPSRPDADDILRCGSDLQRYALRYFILCDSLRPFYSPADHEIVVLLHCTLSLEFMHVINFTPLNTFAKRYNCTR